MQRVIVKPLIGRRVITVSVDGEPSHLRLDQSGYEWRWLEYLEHTYTGRKSIAFSTKQAACSAELALVEQSNIARSHWEVNGVEVVRFAR